MKLGVGVKVAGGFGVVIIIAMILGGMAVYNMKNVGNNSTLLAKEYLPEVKVANDIDGSISKTMYGMRGYVYTEEKRFYDAVTNNLAQLNESLKTAEELSKKSASLAELSANSKKAKEYVDKYTALVKQTVEENRLLAESLAMMVDNAKSFLNNANAYLDIQEKKLDSEIGSTTTNGEQIKELVWKTKTINDIIDIGNSTRIDFYRAIAVRNPEIFQKAMDNFSTAEKPIADVLAKTKEQADVDALKKVLDSVINYKAAMKDFLKNWKAKDELIKQLVATGEEVIKIAGSMSEMGIKDTQNVADNAVKALAASSQVMILGLVIALVIGIAFAWGITNSITKPINRAAEIANMLASQAEELSTVSNTLLSSSEQMTSQSNNISAMTEQMSANITTMASATEEMNVNAQTVSSSSEQMAQNMNNLSGTIEEMSVSMNTVGANAKEGAVIASDAMKMSNSATNTMNILGSAAKEIGQVTEVIKRIAQQTNLLALNATIEAASAGDAGKGFAVVANEIKELANQSAQAAEDITQKIIGVQGKTDEAVKVIKDVSSIIEKLNKSVDIISGLVEEQAKASIEMSSNVAQANQGVNNITASIKEVALGTTEMSKNAGEAAQATSSVSSNISQIKEVAGNTNSNASQVNTSSGELSKLAGELNQIVASIRGK